MWRLTKISKTSSAKMMSLQGSKLAVVTGHHLRVSHFESCIPSQSSVSFRAIHSRSPSEEDATLRRNLVMKRRISSSTSTSSTAASPLLSQRLEFQRRYPQMQPPVREEQHQEAIKLLMDTLMTSQVFAPNHQMGSFPKQQHEEEFIDAIIIDPWLQFFGDMGSSGMVEQRVAAELLKEQEEAEQLIANTAAKKESLREKKEKRALHRFKKRIRDDLKLSLQRKNQQSAMDTFYRVLAYQKRKEESEPNVSYRRQHEQTAIQSKRRSNIKSEVDVDIQASILPLGMVNQLFTLVSNTRPFDAYRVLLYYQQLMISVHGKSCGAKDINTYTGMYERVCDSLRYLDPQSQSYGDIQNLVRSILADMQRLDREGQEKCFPVLLSSLTHQRSVQVAQAFTPRIYQHIVEQDFTVRDGWWEHLLANSRYFRQGDLPYADVMEKIIEKGRRPDPAVVLGALDNFFPFTDCRAMKKALRAIHTLQSDSLSGEAADSNQYVIDISTLEAIGAAAAKNRDVELNLVVWDLIDMYGYEPTEAIYENTAMVFVSSPDTYLETFTILSEMEAAGMKPARALIRGMSTFIRSSVRNIVEAREQLGVLIQSGKPASVSLFNVLLSSAAERGDIDRALSFLDEVERNGLVPNSDSYSFAFEALGKHVRKFKRRSNEDNRNVVEYCLMSGERLLSKMDASGIVPTQHIIGDYTELLCHTGQADTAADVVVDAAKDLGFVNGKIIYRVAMANAKIGRFDEARKVAACAEIPVPYLLQNISEEERRLYGSQGSIEFDLPYRSN